MNSFAFLRRTPSYAKEENCGQFNGYIAFDIQAESVLCKEDENGYEDYAWGGMEVGEAMNVTFHRHTTLKDLGAIYPLTAIPKEAADGCEFVVFGYDTCHIWNSRDENDYDHERAETLKWHEVAKRILLEDFKAFLDRCNAQLG